MTWVDSRHRFEDLQDDLTGNTQSCCKRCLGFCQRPVCLITLSGTCFITKITLTAASRLNLDFQTWGLMFPVFLYFCVAVSVSLFKSDGGSFLGRNSEIDQLYFLFDDNYFNEYQLLQNKLKNLCLTSWTGDIMWCYYQTVGLHK